MPGKRRITNRIGLLLSGLLLIALLSVSVRAETDGVEAGICIRWPGESVEAVIPLKKGERAELNIAWTARPDDLLGSEYFEIRLPRLEEESSILNWAPGNTPTSFYLWIDEDAEAEEQTLTLEIEFSFCVGDPDRRVTRTTVQTIAIGAEGTDGTGESSEPEKPDEDPSGEEGTGDEPTGEPVEASGEGKGDEPDSTDPVSPTEEAEPTEEPSDAEGSGEEKTEESDEQTDDGGTEEEESEPTEKNSATDSLPDVPISATRESASSESREEAEEQSTESLSVTALPLEEAEAGNKAGEMRERITAEAAEAAASQPILIETRLLKQEELLTEEETEDRTASAFALVFLGIPAGGLLMWLRYRSERKEEKND